MSNPHLLFGFITVSAQAAPFVVIFLYAIAGCFLTTAWYAHLKMPESWPWYAFVGVSWGVFALFEYILSIQATRLGFVGGYFGTAQLETIKIATIILSYVIFSTLILGEKFTLHHFAGFSCIAIGAYFIFTSPK